jgi:drug/metabolite transporter (DMT)-like permease
MVKSFFYAVVALALWGLVFVLPLFVPKFSVWEIVIGRYLVYGCLSVPLFLYHGKGKKVYSFVIWRSAFIYSFAVFLLYYILLIFSIRLVGITVCSLIISLLPIVIPVCGNLIQREFPFSVLKWPLIVMGIGLVITNFYQFYMDTSNSNITVGQKLLGIGLIIICLVIWTWYTIVNARLLKSNPSISPNMWSLLIGISAFIQVIICFFIIFFFKKSSLAIFNHQVSFNETLSFIAVIVILGILATWIPMVLWNKVSFSLPIPLLGQMMIFESIFAIIYGYCYQLKVPSMWEVLGMVVMFVGIMLGVKKIAVR